MIIACPRGTLSSKSERRQDTMTVMAFRTRGLFSLKYYFYYQPQCFFSTLTLGTAYEHSLYSKSRRPLFPEESTTSKTRRTPTAPRSPRRGPTTDVQQETSSSAPRSCCSCGSPRRGQPRVVADWRLEAGHAPPSDRCLVLTMPPPSRSITRCHGGQTGDDGESATALVTVRHAQETGGGCRFLFGRYYVCAGGLTGRVGYCDRFRRKPKKGPTPVSSCGKNSGTLESFELVADDIKPNTYAVRAYITQR